MEKILTISIAAYNVEKYIRKTLESLIIDNMDKLEVLIIVDGGNDKTLEIAKEYESKYPNTFKAIYKENGGYGSTINKGIELATGKYFKQLDGDDWFDTTNLNNICLELMKMKDADVIYTPYIKYLEKSKDKIVVRNDIENNLDECDLEKAINNANKEIIMHSLMYKTDILKKNNIHIDEHCFYTDTEYAILPLYYSNTIKILNIPLYVYRIGIDGQSISFESRIKHYKDHETVDQRIIETYRDNNSLTPNLKKYIEDYMVKLFCGTISNFLVILKPSKANFNHIKVFYNEILKLNSNIVIKMKKYSKIIRLLSMDNYCIYLFCHIIRKFKMKYRFK